LVGKRATDVKNPLVVFVLFTIATIAWCSVFVFAVTPKMSGDHRLVSYDLSDDPALGTGVKLPENDSFGRRIDGSEGSVLLIVSATCTGCQSKSIKDSPLLREVDFPIVIIYPDTVAVLRKQFAEKLADNFFVVSDPEEQYSKRLNSIWSPRMYLLSDGQLARVQKEPGEKLSEALPK
jgi:hypothetical protein